MLLLSAVLYGVVWFGASPIAAAFNSEGDRLLQAFAEEGLKLYFIACPFAGFNIILAVYFAATEYAHPARIISLLRGFVLILPMAFALSAGFGMTRGVVRRPRYRGPCGRGGSAVLEQRRPADACTDIGNMLH